MDLSIGGLVNQVTPVLDAVSLVRTGTVDQIASFLRDNPVQRGTIESALASSGRTGDLSTIIERAAAPVGHAVERTVEAAGRVADRVTTTTGQSLDRLVTGGVQTADRLTTAAGQTADRLVTGGTQTIDRLTTTIGQAASTATQALGSRQVVDVAAATVSTAGRTVAGPLGHVVEGAGRTVQATSDALRSRLGGPAGRVIDAANPLGRSVATAEAPRGAMPGDAVLRLSVERSGVQVSRPGDAASLGGMRDALAAAVRQERMGELLALALREGRPADLLLLAAREGRFGELLAVARQTAQLPQMLAAARAMDTVLSLFAAKGGPSATELALLARAGLLSDADARSLRTASEEPVQTLVAPRDGIAEERFARDRAEIDGLPIEGLGDPALARFDAGAIRITSRAAVETYGVLGPPGGMVIAAESFEATVRASDGHPAEVERRLELDGGLLRDADTLVALVERRDLVRLRLVEGTGVLLGRADIPANTPYREMTLARAA